MFQLESISGSKHIHSESTVSLIEQLYHFHENYSLFELENELSFSYLDTGQFSFSYSLEDLEASYSIPNSECPSYERQHKGSLQPNQAQQYRLVITLVLGGVPAEKLTPESLQSIKGAMILLFGVSDANIKVLYLTSQSGIRVLSGAKSSTLQVEIFGVGIERLSEIAASLNEEELASVLERLGLPVKSAIIAAVKINGEDFAVPIFTNVTQAASEESSALSTVISPKIMPDITNSISKRTIIITTTIVKDAPLLNAPDQG